MEHVDKSLVSSVSETCVQQCVNVMKKKKVEEHPGLRPRHTQFKIQVVSQHKSNMVRQLNKALTIIKHPEITLNAKEEYTIG